MGFPPTLYLIDGSSYIYRAFFALKQYLSTKKGFPTNAIYGFVNMLLKIIREEKPDYLAIVFDPKGDTIRHEQYRDYKATRLPMPPELTQQLPYIHKIIQAFNIAALVEEGYEADDVIGTIAKAAESKGFEVTIVSGDKDLFQLISPQIRVLDTMKGKVYRAQEVKERYGVEPDKLVDLLGLMGDSIDNIPGVPGIGQKTAAELINRFHGLDNLLERLDKVEKVKVRNILAQHIDQARLSRQLATIITDLPLEIDLEALKLKEINWPVLQDLFRELEFYSLLKEISQDQSSPQLNCQIVLNEKDFQELLEKTKVFSEIALETVSSQPDPLQGEIVGLAFSLDSKEAFYIPLAHSYLNCPAQLNKKWALTGLKPVLEDQKIKKYGHNLKRDILTLAREGINLQGLAYDTMVISYLLNPSRSNHNLEDVVLEYLNKKKTPLKDLLGGGNKALNFSQVDISLAGKFLAEEVVFSGQLLSIMRPLLQKAELEPLWHEIELPLISVLANMELNGVKIDQQFLQNMSKNLQRELEQLETLIYNLAGIQFNINSPKQLQEVLFERLKLKPVRRTKTGYSTDVAVLEELAMQHELPAQILNYRQLAKLKSTYVDALPQLINPYTGRVHTSFNQTVTATGRLSSSDPNLQNIPIRSTLGREIRKAFVAEEGYRLLSADYSQIELRIMAHLSGDPVLLEAFAKGVDIHQHTAAEVFGVSPDQVTSEMRRMAKTVNFGIMYGMSPYGLAKDLGVSQTEAKNFIESYFTKYAQVKEYINKTLLAAYQDGFVTTILNRRRYIPDLKSENKNVREFAERTAINTPIQGSAADLIKLAMVRIHKEIKKRNLSSKMILQVHDELLFEVPLAEQDIMLTLVKELMENVIPLKVPLVVDVGVGNNWEEVHA
jgi:DNA polymerase-1